ncbi:hypothetical protein [Amycolatopsis dendrobii]|uniref:Uncharacterized protein n=1 Tax=Amycolatopsis dendrobii TaxID=2760662 RepID=A0A7W3VVD0_9PSEU|nr:hypothetical protein [Amycolatopsis dendrobii]MBB1153487.1 hypothetical protein [Amycolatopsis dendrobii]
MEQLRHTTDELLTRLRGLLAEADGAPKRLLSGLRESIEALDAALSTGAPLPRAWQRSAGDIVRRTASAPSPPPTTVEPKMEIGPLLVVTTGNPHDYEVFDCWHCEGVFPRNSVAVIARYPSETVEEAPYALHSKCAEEILDSDRPIVVTLHRDGTASVTGPADTAVTVVVETA